MQHYLNAGDLSSFKNYSVRSEIAPVDVEDGVEVALMEALEEAYMTTIGCTQDSASYRRIVTTTAL